MILRAKIENKMSRARVVRWVSTGVYLAPGESVEVELSELPDYTEKNFARIKNMETEITDGVIGLTVITNLPVEAPKDILVEEEKPKVKASKKVKVKEMPKVTDQINPERIFASKSLDERAQESISMDNNESKPPEPITVEMFADATSVNVVKAEKGEVDSVFTSTEAKEKPVEEKPKKRRGRKPVKKAKEENSGD